MAVINTGAVERNITGVNESDLFLDESTSTVNNTGAVEREIEASHDANFVHPLGDESVINGGFDTDSDWIEFDGWSIVDGRAINDGSGGILRQSNVAKLNTAYKVVFTVSNYITGSISVKIAPEIKQATITGNGVYTIETDGTNSINGDLQILSVNSFTGSIDNVSVKEVLVNRESTVTNTGAARRSIEGINESDLFLNESSSNVNNTGTIERSVLGVNESDTF